MPGGPGGYQDYTMAPVEKSPADIAHAAAKMLQALSFVVLALGILAVLGLIVLAFTSSYGKGEAAVQALTTLVTTVGFFGLLRFAGLAADYFGDKYEENPPS